ncbi:WbqC family protein, partial [Desulfovibrio sp. OttesenSCG-928-C14]|nr:WbqC family protein [Desulfovibrio sp. OttesenSCG-928-C14]
QGTMWLTVPVRVKGQFFQKIRHTKLDGVAWQSQHWKNLSNHYLKAPCFSAIKEWLEPLYLQYQYQELTELNLTFIKATCDYLGITTKISVSWDYQLIEGKTERLADLCRQAGATEYISGPAAKDYINESVFDRINIQLSWFDYEGYPEYPQLWGDFTHYVSILDLLFNCGKNSARYMKFVQP